MDLGEIFIPWYDASNSAICSQLASLYLLGSRARATIKSFTSAVIACLGLRPLFLWARDAAPCDFTPFLRRFTWRELRSRSSAAWRTVSLPAMVCSMTYRRRASFWFKKMSPLMVTSSQSRMGLAICWAEDVTKTFLALPAPGLGERSRGSPVPGCSSWGVTFSQTAYRVTLSQTDNRKMSPILTY